MATTVTSDGNTEVEAAAALGAATVSAEQRVVEYQVEGDGPLVLLALRDEGQQWEMAEKAMAYLEHHRPTPRARTNTPTFRELDSFVEYVNRFKGPNTVIFADDAKSRVVAVFDYHPEGPDQRAAGWGRHRAEYTCPLAPEWVAWNEIDGKAMSQEDLATFLDEHSADLVEDKESALAAPNEIVTLSRNLHIVSKGTVTRKVNEATGEYEMVNKLEHVEQSTSIPKGFKIGVSVYIGGDRYGVEMRLRFRVADGRPTFAMVIQRKIETLRDAFAAVRDAAGEKTGVPVYVGTHNL
jgi:uncharacterized protein YfdQ (DUF2303 family)